MFQYTLMLIELDKTNVTSFLFDFHSKALIFAEMSVYNYLTATLLGHAVGFQFGRGLSLFFLSSKECEIIC